jgi:adenosylcobinamide-GDP ribazoletransferase
MQELFFGLKFAFSYFSILPVHFKKEDDLSTKPVIGTMLFFFPLVGLVLGLLTIMIASISHSWLFFLIAAIAYMLMYGFIHTEAVCDVADALYAKHAGKDAHVIIKEPTIGAIGMFYGVAFFTLKVAAIVALFQKGSFYDFVAVLLISRLSIVALIMILPFKSSFIGTLKPALTPSYVTRMYGLFSLVGLFLMGSQFLFFLLFGGILSYIIARFLGNKLGFINGDVLGATLESVEIALFIILVASF